MQEPLDDTYTHFRWQKAPIKVIQPMIMAYNPEQIQTLSFQEKSAWFRFNL
jgi:hypothetical protein